MRQRVTPEQQRESFQLKHVFASLATLPTIARLVWRASPQQIFWTAVLCLGRGLIPALSATIIIR